MGSGQVYGVWEMPVGRFWADGKVAGLYLGLLSYFKYDKLCQTWWMFICRMIKYNNEPECTVLLKLLVHNRKKLCLSRFIFISQLYSVSADCYFTLWNVYEYEKYFSQV